LNARRLLSATILCLAAVFCGRPPAAAEPKPPPHRASAPSPAGTPAPSVAAAPRPTALNQVGPVSPRRVVFHPRDPDRLLIMEAKEFAAVWNVANMQRPFKEIAILTTAFDAAFAPDGESVVTANRDGSVHCWDVHGKEKWVAKPAGDAMMHAIAATAHPPTIAVGGADRRIHLLGADGKSRATLDGHDGIVLSLAFSADGEWLASDGSDTLVRLWRRKKGGGYEQVRSFRTPNERYRKMLPNLVRLDVQWGWGETVAFSPDGRLLLAPNFDGTAQIWKLDGTPQTQPFTNHDEQHVRSVAYSPRGDVVATAGFDGTIKLWKPDGSPYQSQAAARHVGVATSVSFSADGSRIATTGLDDLVRISLLDGTPVGTLPRGRAPRPLPHEKR
jgi:WD40 repeat protein